MDELIVILLYTGMAGAAIPLGGLIAYVEHFSPGPLREDFLHGTIAFGGGVLLSAVALVLVPHGIANLSPVASTLAFVLGAVFFLCIDRIIQNRGGKAAQLLAMIMDFGPEAVALGAAYGSGEKVGPLLALLIALQNLPEGFNAYKELILTGKPKNKALFLLTKLTIVGPLAGLGGYVFLQDSPALVSWIMLIAAGGILYLTFQDIAPQSKIERQWTPALGAVAGFWVGILGKVWLSS